MTVIIYIVAILLLVLALLFLRYRISYSENIKGESELKYKLIDLGQQDVFRNYFELLICKRKRVFLKNAFEVPLYINSLHKQEQNNFKIHWLYINKVDFVKLYPESPIKMKEENYSILFKFETKRLLFGGYRNAKIISHEKIIGKPMVLKS